MMAFITLLQNSALAQYYFAAVLCLWPVLRAYRRMGLSCFYVVLLFVPLLGFALVMLAALRKWPLLPPQPPRPKRAKKETAA